MTVDGVEITTCAGGPAATAGIVATTETSKRLHKISAVLC